MPAEVEALRAAYRTIRERIDAACRRADRDPSEVDVVAVSKSVPVERLRSALAAGIQPFGENRVQEAVAKATQLPPARWHLVGRLQSNKVARATELFEVIHSVDSTALGGRLGRQASGFHDGRPMLVYLQVNVDQDPQKQGFAPEDLDVAVAALVGQKGLRLLGLMTVGRLVERAEDARPTFRRLRELSVGLRVSHPELGPGLSMGMSDDFEVAVEEGATVLRIGRALFGVRPAA